METTDCLTRVHSRRHFLATGSMGIASLAVASLLDREGVRADQVRPELQKRSYDLAPKPPAREPRARAMISLFMQGGPSQIDLLDPKPEMARYDGKKFPGKIKYDNAAQASAKVFPSPWKFRNRGKSGIEVSELLPNLAEVIDELTVIRSMHTGVNNHGQSIYALNTGRVQPGRPSLGSWIGYALGSESDNLPAFVALRDPHSLPVVGVQNWTNGWLPSLYQGTVVRSEQPRIVNLNPPAHLKGAPQRAYLDFLRQLNNAHLSRHPGELDLEARIASYELGGRMQVSALEALDLSGESESTKEMYGLNAKETADYGTRCLIARRLVERGVRFIQIYTRNQFWDHHGGIRSGLPAACRMTDRPSAALVRDLKQRGLLDTTVVHWGGEMGRLPVIQNDAGPNKIGRDHNTHGFTMWLAGGGFRSGHVHGATDDFGHRAVQDTVHHYDYHATLMHLFGLDPDRVVYLRNGQEHSLIDRQPCRVVHEVLS